MIDDRTPKRNLPLPHVDNPLIVDVERLRQVITALDEFAAVLDLDAAKIAYAKAGLDADTVKEALDYLVDGLSNIDLNAENVTYDQPNGGPITAAAALDAILGYMQTISYSFTSKPAFSGVDPRIVVGGNLSYLDIQQKRADLGASNGSVRVRFLSDNDTEVAAIFVDGSNGLLRFYSRDNVTLTSVIGMIIGSKTSPTTTIGLPKTAAATETVILNGAAVRPNTSGTTELGTTSQRWSTVWSVDIKSTNAAQTTSDERQKQDIDPIPDAVLDAWSDVEYIQYRLVDAVETKGDKARLHPGLVAQRVQRAFEDHGLDPFAYGILCYEEWGALEEERGGDGEIITEAREAGSLYTVRYEEAFALEAALMRRELKRMKESLGLSG